MDESLEQLKGQLSEILADFNRQAPLEQGDIFVVGCSTSEVIGQLIGTCGTMEVAELIFTELKSYADSKDIRLAFQCCEHLNRALVVEKDTAKAYQLESVTVTPVRSAGGALPTYAYHNMENPVVVEFVKAAGGIDIGDTFIGMHLKHVAVPVRTTTKQLGHAHVTLARTRSKLIGGERAVYSMKEKTFTCG
ncbi:TIGR01440 family protein [Priestia taiwanensis]|uniref:UPF0340 protein GCM10007140_34500 n=1 Tax=Priestia taiwanensis TaxID=1347902 RepID=A0A917AYP9_9BACI|nr:TIGR01440 family protein [Priestia taiwanensis]MBM7364991.1 uncharacterized protein (TIGR01440 family) [Priestia taiwanensis]GGE81939.1 UPF0340 protein [Priestia taiwanensis]